MILDHHDEIMMSRYNLQSILILVIDWHTAQNDTVLIFSESIRGIMLTYSLSRPCNLAANSYKSQKSRLNITPTTFNNVLLPDLSFDNKMYRTLLSNPVLYFEYCNTEILTSLFR